MKIIELNDFLFENYYRQIGFSKKNSYHSMKHQSKKDLLFLATKLIEKKYLMLVMLKNITNII